MEQTSGLKQSLSGQAALMTELLSTAIEPQLRKHGLTPAMFDLLSAVHACDGSASQASIARRLRVSAPTLSEAVRNAENRGLLVTERSDKDRRQRVVKLTDVGQRAVVDALQTLNQLEMQVVEEFEDRELRAAVAVLKRVNQRIAAKIRDSMDS